MINWIHRNPFIFRYANFSLRFGNFSESSMENFSNPSALCFRCIGESRVGRGMGKRGDGGRNGAKLLRDALTSKFGDYFFHQPNNPPMNI